MRLPKIPYKILLAAPWLAYGLGSALNFIAVGINGGLMPVQGYVGVIGDGIHQGWSASTHLKFLCDWLLLPGLGTASVGDLFLWGWEATWLPALSAWVALILKDNSDGQGRY